MDLNTPSGRQHALDAAQHTADEHQLPLSRHNVHDGTIHAYINNPDDLGDWLNVAGGHITVVYAASQVVRTLHTFTDAYGGWTGIPLHVHALTHAAELVMPEIAAATLRSTAA